MGGRGALRVLITGGTGFIGTRLSRAALARGWTVFLMTRRPEGASAGALALAGARLVMADVTDRESVRRALEVARPQRLFHNAGWYELGIAQRSRRPMRAVNVDGTENILSLAAEMGIERVIYTSSTTALGDTGGDLADERFERQAPPRSWYEATKAEGHRLAVRHQRAGEPVIIVAPAQVVGEGDHSPFGIMARLFVRRRLPPVAWAPEGAFTFGHVDDVAAGIVAAGDLGRPGEIYFLGGEVLTLREMMAIWSRLERRRAVRLWLPRPLALGQAALAGPILRLFGWPAFISTEVVRSSYVSFRYTSAKAINELGISFRPAAQAWEDTLRAGGRVNQRASPEARR